MKHMTLISTIFTIFLLIIIIPQNVKAERCGFLMIAEEEDNDGDCIYNSVDRCPSLHGEIEYNGCPSYDLDGDGFYNSDPVGEGIPPSLGRDNCEYIFGTYFGCPQEGMVCDKKDIEDCPEPSGEETEETNDTETTFEIPLVHIANSDNTQNSGPTNETETANNQLNVNNESMLNQYHNLLKDGGACSLICGTTYPNMMIILLMFAPMITILVRRFK